MGYGVDMSALLEAIKTEVEKRDESLRAVSRGSGVSVAQLSRLMSGERGLSIDAAEKLADYLGLRIRIDRKPRTRKSR
jgi:transcriptional regulator with XRE-family HTH domain